MGSLLSHVSKTGRHGAPIFVRMKLRECQISPASIALRRTLVERGYGTGTVVVFDGALCVPALFTLTT
jgi:hypothetical protein